MNNRFIAAGLFDSRSETPLTEPQLRALAPSIFASSAYHDVSPNFRFYSTWHALQALAERGFMPVSARQGKTRNADRESYTRHMIRLRHASEIENGGEFLPEICLLNAHDRTSSYRILGGGFRPICRNGMIVKSELAQDIRIPHSRHQLEDVIEATFRVIEQVRRLTSSVKRWQATPTTIEQRIELARIAHSLRFAHAAPESGQAIVPTAFLEARREGDKASDLWTVFNRVQENLMRGGQEATARVTRKDAAGNPVTRLRTIRTRPLNSIGAEIDHNAVLWAAAEKVAA
jgi:hypothetical protein